MNLVNTTYNSSKDIINKLQDLKGKRKLKFYRNINNYYDEISIRNFKFEDDPFSKNAQGISKIYHEVLLLINFSQTKPQVKNMNFKNYDLYYTVIKSRVDNEVVVDKYEDNENDFINFKDFITLDHNLSMKPRETILKWRKLRSIINFYEYRQTLIYRSV